MNLEAGPGTEQAIENEIVFVKGLFSEFINDQSMSQGQIVFVKKVIDYVVQNGYIDSVTELTKPPLDKPQGFVKLFDGTKQQNW